MDEWLTQFNLSKNLTELSNNITSFTTMTKDFFHMVGQAYYYLSHPAILAHMIWSGVVGISFWLCLALCFAGIIMYLVGYSKGATVAKSSFFSYLALQVINSML